MIKKLNNNKSANAANASVTRAAKLSSSTIDFLSDIYIGEVKKAFVSQWKTVKSFIPAEDETFCACIKRIACVHCKSDYDENGVDKICMTVATTKAGKPIANLDSEWEMSIWARIAKNSLGVVKAGDTLEVDEVSFIKRQHVSDTDKNGKPLVSWTAVISRD